MSLNAATLRLLVEKGLSASDIVEVAESIEAGKPRSTNAERQARFRARRKAESVTNNVTSNGVTEDQTAPYIEIPPVSPKGDTAPQGAKRSRGSRIPDDWQPPAVDELPPEARALAKQWTDASYRREAEGFRCFWQAESGARASKVNWTTAWANRISQVNWRVLKDQKSAAPPSASNDYLEHRLAMRARSP